MSADHGAIAAALTQFSGVVLDHPRLKNAMRELETATLSGLPPSVTLLLGPTGVGKTTVLSVFGKRPDPVVMMRCQAPSVGDFRFTALHWQQLAGAAGDSLCHAHRCPDTVADGLRRGRARTVEEHRLGVLAMLKRRGARVIIYDEAQLMARTRRVQAQAAQLDVIRSDVDFTQIPHVLAGTYALSSMVFPNDQCARRTRLVHFRPYYWRSEDDQEAFGMVFGQLLLELPLPDPRRSLDALADHRRDIFRGSVGCVGIAKEWLGRACQAVLRTGGVVVDWNALHATRLSDGALAAIAREIVAYEDIEGGDLVEVERSLGMRHQLDMSTGRPPKRPTARRRSTRARPGTRKPGADPTGLSERLSQVDAVPETRKGGHPVL